MKKYKLRSHLYLIPMLILFIVIVLIYHTRYRTTVSIIKSEYESKLDLIEESIYNETRYTEVISGTLEKDIHNLMEKNSQLLVEKYKENPNILEWDFNDIKKEYNMDIYIINNHLEIIASSIEEEVGMDFHKHIDLSMVLQKRFKEGQFESDEINFSIIKGELKKYSYMPTPDNKYLIELSVDIKNIYPDLNSLNIVYLSEELKNRYNFLENVRVYKFNLDRENSHELDTVNTEINSNTELYRKIAKDKYVEKALVTNKAQEQLVKEKGVFLYRLKYIPYIVTEDCEKNNISRCKSYVIELVYNDKKMMEKLVDQKKIFTKSILLLSFIYFGVTSIIINLIGKNRKIADRDHLTKLFNRKKFEEIIRYKILNLKNKDNKIAILFFDLDKFKDINDTYGHDFGYKVLQEVANKIKNELRKEDIVSRLGGDEFTASISGFKSEKEIIEVVDRMASIFDSSIEIDSKEVFIRPSIGVSIYPDHGKTVETLILKADDAMYRAKQSGIKYKIYKNPKEEK